MINPIKNNKYIGTSHAARKGIQGLASGLDIPELVKGMTLGTRSKIAKFKQSQTLIGWKMDAYRGITKNLRSFNDKFLSSTSNSFLRSKESFSKTKIETVGPNGKYVSVKTSDLEQLKNFSVKSINSLAERASFSTNNNVTNQKITSGVLDLDNKQTVNLFAGAKFGFKHNGREVEIKIKDNFRFSNPNDAETSLNELSAAFNEAIENSELRGKVKFSVTNESGPVEIKIEEKEGHVLTIAEGDYSAFKAMGIRKGAQIEGNGKLIGKSSNISTAQEEVSIKENLKDKTIKFKFNGVEKTIGFKNYTFNQVSDVADAFQKELDKAFGRGNITVSESGGKLEFTTRSDSIIEVTKADLGLLGENGILKMNPGDQNRLNLDIEMKKSGLLRNITGTDLKINGVEFNFDESDSIQKIIDTVNNSSANVNMRYVKTMDKFIITSKNTGEGHDINVEGSLANALFDAGNSSAVTVKSGKDAEVTVKINGIEQTFKRSSNSFEVDGLNLELKGTFNAATTAEEVTFSGKRETDDIVKNVKEMIEGYNKLLEEAVKESTVPRNREYKPLTDEQKEEMTEKEIEKWEKEAKKGVLCGESEINRYAEDIKSIFSSENLAELEEMGIKISSNYKENGKIEFDERKFVEALNKDADKVGEVFTRESGMGGGGIMVKMDNLIKKYTKTTGYTKGLFIERAGMENSYTSVTNSLWKEMRGFDDRIKDFNGRLKREEDRYYKQFTRLEKYMSIMNAQSGWLAGQLGM